MVQAGVSKTINLRPLPRSIAAIRPTTPEDLSNRRQPMRQAKELGKERLARRGGVALPSNVDLINELREERDRELEEIAERNRR